MRTLTLEEASRVASNRKTPRPAYYSAQLDSDVRISLDMEAWIILAPLAVRARFATWLQQQSELSVRDTVLDELTTEYLTDELANATAERDALQELFQPYDDFRSSLPIAGFEDVGELTVLLAQTQVGLNRLNESREESVFRYAMQNLLKNTQDDVQGDGLEQQKIQRELQSWVPLLLAYGT